VPLQNRQVYLACQIPFPLRNDRFSPERHLVCSHLAGLIVINVRCYYLLVRCVMAYLAAGYKCLVLEYRKLQKLQ
jgi:hypothetical protein